MEGIVLNRDEVVFCDFITVKSTDGSFEKDTLVLEDFYLKKDEGKSNFWSRQRKCAQATLDAWINDGLKAGYTELTFPPEDKSVGYLNICIRAKDIPDGLWDVLNECGQKSTCIYSGCLPMANMAMTTYRDNYGCIGRSWEINMVISLKSESCYKIREVHDVFGPYAAGLYIMKMYKGNVDDEVAKINGLTELIEKLEQEEV